MRRSLGIKNTERSITYCIHGLRFEMCLMACPGRFSYRDFCVLGGGFVNLATGKVLLLLEEMRQPEETISHIRPTVATGWRYSDMTRPMMITFNSLLRRFLYRRSVASKKSCLDRRMAMRSVALQRQPPSRDSQRRQRRAVVLYLPRGRRAYEMGFPNEGVPPIPLNDLIRETAEPHAAT
jgi:hypothetical protein